MSIAVATSLPVASACRAYDADHAGPERARVDDGTRATEPSRGADWAARRASLMETLEAKGIRSQAVLAAMKAVPRHRFVPAELRDHAYEDHALPIGMGQTISQPYVVAYMTELLDVKRGDRILEVGTGSGYQAAVLAEMGAEVYSVEIVPELSERAAEVLADLGYDSVHLRVGDGYAGWPEHAPYDGIIVTAVAPSLPDPLVAQLTAGGRIVIPLEEAGGAWQSIWLVEKDERGKLTRRKLLPVAFVPMTGAIRERKKNEDAGGAAGTGDSGRADDSEERGK